MREVSELDIFLSESRSEGKVDSEGGFTVSREQALAKLAAYQLPFEGAWAAKIIQCAVSVGQAEPISVEIGRSESRFLFSSSAWNLDDFERAFYDIDATTDRSLRYLLEGLWPLALGEQRRFLVALAGQAGALYWNGERLTRVSRCASNHTTVGVAHRGKSRFSGRARTCAEISDVFRKYCFTSPVPLTLDGRRIDSLQHCPVSGWSKTVYPLTIGFAEAELPDMAIPPGTFEDIPRPRHPERGDKEEVITEYTGGGIRAVGEAIVGRVGLRKKAPVAFTLCFPMTATGFGSTAEWSHKKCVSNVFWVRDGVLVDREILATNIDSDCSLACFLSAESLDSDLSTFRLRESHVRSQRVKRAREAIHKKLSTSLDHLIPTAAIFKIFERRGVIVSGAFVAAGSVLCLALPPLGLVVAAMGAAKYRSAGKQNKAQLTHLLDKVEELQRALS